MTEFVVNRTDKIVGRTERTRSGFRHVVGYYRGGRLLGTHSVSYLNRTWESYEYETAIQGLMSKLNKSAFVSNRRASATMAAIRKRPPQDNMFRTTAMTAALGDVFGRTQKEKNDWKTRMLKAGMGNRGLIMPEDWGTLPENVKARRLNKVIGFMKTR